MFVYCLWANLCTVCLDQRTQIFFSDCIWFEFSTVCLRHVRPSLLFNPRYLSTDWGQARLAEFDAGFGAASPSYPYTQYILPILPLLPLSLYYTYRLNERSEFDAGLGAASPLYPYTPYTPFIPILFLSFEWAKRIRRRVRGGEPLISLYSLHSHYSIYSLYPYIILIIWMSEANSTPG